MDTLYKASRRGDYKKVMKYTEKLYQDWDTAFVGACEGNHLDIVKFLIRRSTNKNACLYIACRRGYRELIDILIYYGANNWNRGLAGACKGGHTDIVYHMINNGATDVDHGLEHACRSGNIMMMKLMIELGANDWDLGLAGACEGRDMTCVDTMIRQGATNYQQALFVSRQFQHRELVKMMDGLLTVRKLEI